MSDSERHTEPPEPAAEEAPSNVVPLRPRPAGLVDAPGPAAPPPTPIAPGRDAPPPGEDDDGGGGDDGEPPRRRVRIKKLRMLLLLAGLTALASISTVFGMMMAVASDLPALEEPASTNSVMVDREGNEIGLLTGNQRRIFLGAEDIAPRMKQAIIAIEDKRFYTNDGVDLRGSARALWTDIIERDIVQGGSTITQQFVKVAQASEQNRSLLNKLREAALAYHITRKWDKQRILRNYLNSIYFGNGAYGIESAARVYFGSQHAGCGEKGARPCAAVLEPHEAALLAGIVQSPSAYDPLQHPQASKARRDTVLDRMLEQGFLSRLEHDTAVVQPLPVRNDFQFPREDTRYPYFTSWVKQQVVDKLGGGQVGARLAFEGGLRVRTTIDAKLQGAAENAIEQWLPSGGGGPRASLVALDNETGEVRAMVGGDDYATSPFNLATQGQRQPGSAFKPFVLAEALKAGVSPSSTWESKKKVFKVPGSSEKFTVTNYENSYSGVTSLDRATYFSDNAVYSQVGIQVGTRKIARLARKMGIRSPVSDNYAMTLGGLRQGITPMDLAHAYGTFATGGQFVYGTMSPGDLKRNGLRRPGPVGISAIGRGRDEKFKPVELPSGERARNKTRRLRVLDPAIAGQVTGLLKGAVKYGTGTRAQLDLVEAAGKTGTTENYGDAWFVGYTKEYTVAVWVGYPDRFQPMETEFQGSAVAGGTFPAGIWKTFMDQLLNLDPPKQADRVDESDDLPEPGAVAPEPGVEGEAAPEESAPAPESGDDGATVPEAEAPAPEVEEAPAPEAEAPAPEEAAPEEAAPPTDDGGATPP